MNINTSKFILGRPIKLPFGEVRFVTVDEYLELSDLLHIISLSPINIYHIERKSLVKTLKRKELYKLEELKVKYEDSLYNLVLNDDTLLDTYLQVFNMLITFKEPYQSNDMFTSEEVFNYIRDLIMQMNFLKEEKAFKNEELQELHEMSKIIKSKGNKFTIEDMITSVRSFLKLSYDEVFNSTIYQLNADFLRICAMKDYDTSILFATVSSEAKIEHWTKHIDLLKELDDTSVKESEFKNTVSNALKS